MGLFSSSDYLAAGFKMPGGLTAEQFDALLLPAVELAIGRSIRRKLAPETITEFPASSVQPSSHLWLSWEVRNGAFGDVEAWDDWEANAGQSPDPAPFPDETKLTTGTDFYVDPRMRDCLVMAGGRRWGIRPGGSFKVVYPTGDWADADAVPADLKLAIFQCARVAGMGWNTLGLVSSETVGRYAYTVATGSNVNTRSQTVEVESILASYRRPIG